MKLPVYSVCGDFIRVVTVPRNMQVGQSLLVSPVAPVSVRLSGDRDMWVPEHPGEPPAQAMLRCFEFGTGNGWRGRALQTHTHADEAIIRKGNFV